jgi:ABC-type nitrate/sulfonate/bicarbonate transport system substrate-binding protein
MEAVRYQGTPPRDYTVIEAPFPAMADMLTERKADLVTGVMPFSLNPVLTQSARVLFQEKDGLGRSQFAFWVMRKSFKENNSAALVDFMTTAEDSARSFRLAVYPSGLLQRPKRFAGPGGPAKVRGYRG